MNTTGGDWGAIGGIPGCVYCWKKILDIIDGPKRLRKKFKMDRKLFYGKNRKRKGVKRMKEDRILHFSLHKDNPTVKNKQNNEVQNNKNKN